MTLQQSDERVAELPASRSRTVDRVSNGFWTLTIRGKIAVAFVSICAIVGAIGWFAVSSMTRAGDLLIETYDRPLMSISFARAIHADFASMEAMFVRRLIEPDAERQRVLDGQVAEAGQTLADDLKVATERASSERVRHAVSQVERAVAAWNTARAAAMPDKGEQPDWAAIDQAAAVVREQIDLLVNYAAGDGFRQRKAAMATIEDNRTVQMAGAGLAAAIAALIMFGLSRRILKPVGEASHAARRIAEGELDVPIAISGRDELASLLGAMSVMRDKIQAMMELEVSQRRSAEMRLVDAIESSSEGVVLIDVDGRVLLSNAQMTALCGAAFAPRAGDTMDMAAQRMIEGNVFRADSAQARAQMEIALRLDEPLNAEAELSSGRWVRLSRSRSTDGGAIFVFSDISLMKERESVLREAAARAEAANKAKSDFLATMSHELRTPLNAVIGFSDIIASEVLGPHAQPQYGEYARDILVSGRRLLSIVNDILLLVKSESGDLQLDIDEVDLVDVVERCADTMSEAFDRADVLLETGPHDAVGWVAGDESRLRVVINNLLSNASKFTLEGGRTSIRVGRHSDGRPAVTIADTGIGMAADDIPRALSAFGQVDGSRSRRYEGAGLGLTIAKAIVDLHGGELLIASVPDEGTCVTVVLPAAGVEPLALAS